MLKVYVNKRGHGEELKWEQLTPEELGSLASTSALFGGSRTFVLSSVLYSERGEELLEFADALAESPHTFIVEEEKLLKAERIALEKAGAKIEEEKKVKSEYKFDNFGVATALGTKDRKKLWLALTAALRAGEKPEALAGLMAWKARQMRDVALSRALTFMYHDAHRGLGDLELLLERFVLTL
ncbi:MAG: hypothetical protein KGI70_01450 [Patescibacteria group bacterium]|nr:hypothetical protein [Patescibacteria group bacterium]